MKLAQKSSTFEAQVWNSLKKISDSEECFYLGTLGERYAEGLIRQRRRRWEAVNTHTVASKKLAYTNWLSHENIACDIGAEDSRGSHWKKQDLDT